MHICPACGGTDVQTDPFSNDIMCANTLCFALIEENRIVAEVGFTESKDGKVAVSGQKVSWEQNNGFAKGEAREITISKGHRILEGIANGLSLKTHLVEQGKRIFLLAVQRNFTKGRITKLVCASCLYIVCRRDRSPHLLIDFSDILQVSVKQIGQVYMKLVRLLNFDSIVDVPLVDPSLFMERFATKLSLPSNQAVHEVTQTAIRFVQAMNRDWICTGRRPTGLCGAALLLASRYHGHRILASEVSTVVRMGECTLKRRLFELKQTPLAMMDRKTFELTDFRKPSQESFPPAMMTNVQRELHAIEEAKAQSLKAIEEARNAPKALAEDPTLMIEDGAVGGGKEVRSLDGRLSPSRSEAPTPSSSSNAPPPSPTRKEPVAKQYPEFSEGVNLEQLDTRNLEAIAVQLQEALKPGDLPKTDFNKDDWKKTEFEKDDFDPTACIVSASPETEASVPATPGAAEAQWETLSDIDSDDVDLGTVLTEEEQAAKRDVWNEVNKDYLEEMHIRERQKARKRLELAQRDPGKRAKRTETKISVGSVGEATRLVLDSKARSVFKEMPDNVLEELFS